jgi:hypothetical protein
MGEAGCDLTWTGGPCSRKVQDPTEEGGDEMFLSQAGLL